MSTEKKEPVAYEEFEQYWDARWLDTQALRDEYRRTSVVDIARQAFNAGIECSAETFASQLQAAVAAERERCVTLVKYWLTGKEPAHGTYEFRCLEAIRQLGDEQ